MFLSHLVKNVNNNSSNGSDLNIASKSFNYWLLIDVKPWGWQQFWQIVCHTKYFLARNIEVYCLHKETSKTWSHSQMSANWQSPHQLLLLHAIIIIINFCMNIWNINIICITTIIIIIICHNHPPCNHLCPFKFHWRPS